MSAPIAIVAAMQEELDALLGLFPSHEELVHFQTRLFKAMHGGQEVVIAQSGMGKVNAACTLALLLSDFAPACVINIGCAGGLHPDQEILDLVVPREILYTDVDVTPLGVVPGQMPGSPPRFHSSPDLMAHFLAIGKARPDVPRCHHGILGSADAFIHTEAQVRLIRDRFDHAVDCVDMEGAAIAHVCTRFDVPFLILRALSDVSGKGAAAVDFHAFLQKASANSASLCLALVERLAAS
jgi:adenosylhomocysteine nucleosidase